MVLGYLFVNINSKVLGAPEKYHCDAGRFGGAEGIRTLDLLDAIEARFQLRHGPTGRMNFYSTWFQ
jgi:hypothetical protein